MFIRFDMIHKRENIASAHIFVSPGDAPGASTLNVVWMEREFDAYKLSRCMCPSNYNRFWDTARYWSKSSIFSYPLHSTPPLGGFPSEHRHPFWYGKTRMVWLPDGEKIFKISLFVLAQLTNVTDRRTDTGWQQRPRLYIASRGKNWCAAQKYLDRPTWRRQKWRRNNVCNIFNPLVSSVPTWI